MSFYSIIILVWVFSEIVLAKFKRASSTAGNHDKSSLLILWTTICASILIGKSFNNYYVLSICTSVTLVELSGIIFICVGLLIRWLAILILKKSFTVNITVSEDQTIVQSGIYKYIRHPAYLGSLLSFLGLGVETNNWLTLIIIFIPILTAFLNRISIEERVLNQVLGDSYINYSSQSWKLIPKIY